MELEGNVTTRRRSQRKKITDATPLSLFVQEAPVDRQGGRQRRGNGQSVPARATSANPKPRGKQALANGSSKKDRSKLSAPEIKTGMYSGGVPPLQQPPAADILKSGGLSLMRSMSVFLTQDDRIILADPGSGMAALVTGVSQVGDAELATIAAAQKACGAPGLSENDGRLPLGAFVPTGTEGNNVTSKIQMVPGSDANVNASNHNSGDNGGNGLAGALAGLLALKSGEVPDEPCNVTSVKPKLGVVTGAPSPPASDAPPGRIRTAKRARSASPPAAQLNAAGAVIMPRPLDMWHAAQVSLPAKQEEPAAPHSTAMSLPPAIMSVLGAAALRPAPPTTALSNQLPLPQPLRSSLDTPRNPEEHSMPSSGLPSVPPPPPFAPQQSFSRILSKETTPSRALPLVKPELPIDKLCNLGAPSLAAVLPSVPLQASSIFPALSALPDPTSTAPQQLTLPNKPLPPSSTTPTANNLTAAAPTASLPAASNIMAAVAPRAILPAQNLVADIQRHTPAAPVPPATKIPPSPVPVPACSPVTAQVATNITTARSPAQLDADPPQTAAATAAHKVSSINSLTCLPSGDASGADGENSSQNITDGSLIANGSEFTSHVSTTDPALLSATLLQCSPPCAAMNTRAGPSNRSVLPAVAVAAAPSATGACEPDKQTAGSEYRDFAAADGSALAPPGRPSSLKQDNADPRTLQRRARNRDAARRTRLKKMLLLQGGESRVMTLADEVEARTLELKTIQEQVQEARQMNHHLKARLTGRENVVCEAAV